MANTCVVSFVTYVLASFTAPTLCCQLVHRAATLVQIKQDNLPKLLLNSDNGS